jgi:hypothetical protein
VRESRLHGTDRQAQGYGGLRRRQFGDQAQVGHLPILGREAAQSGPEGVGLDGCLGVVRGRSVDVAAVEAGECSSVAPEAAVRVPDAVQRDPEQPRPEAPLHLHSAVPTAPRLQEYDRDEILGDAGVLAAPRAESQQVTGVGVERDGEVFAACLR